MQYLNRACRQLPVRDRPHLGARAIGGGSQLAADLSVFRSPASGIAPDSRPPGSHPARQRGPQQPLRRVPQPRSSAGPCTPAALDQGACTTPRHRRAASATARQGRASICRVACAPPRAQRPALPERSDLAVHVTAAEHDPHQDSRASTIRRIDQARRPALAGEDVGAPQARCLADRGLHYQLIMNIDFSTTVEHAVARPR